MKKEGFLENVRKYGFLVKKMKLIKVDKSSKFDKEWG